MKIGRDLRKFYVAGKRQWGAALSAAAVLGVGGCATVGGGGGLTRDTPAPVKAEAVTKRALERWELVIKGETKAAYGYLSPASREVTPLARFEDRMKKGNFRAVKPDETSCEAETCRIRLWLTFDHRAMTGVTTPIEESWVIEGGQAWLVYRD